MSATGGTVVEEGGYRYHTFTTAGDLVVASAVTVDAVLVAGGGSGGRNGSWGGGGGGAGGVLELAAVPLTAGTYPVAVGAGAAAPSSTTAPGGSGGDSTWNSQTATGGGGGGGASAGPGTGGSGGGGSNGAQAGAAGTSGQGFAGGDSTTSAANGYRRGGGGGSSAAGEVGDAAAPGGAGGGGAVPVNFSAVLGAVGGGGGGGSWSGTSVGPGGSGGGGDGGYSESVATAGAANTGGGGGGSWGDAAAGAGGSGVVVIRYALAAPPPEPPPVRPTDFVTYNGFPLATPAWRTVDLSPLYDLRPYRGDPLGSVIPYREGRVARRTVPDSVIVDLPMVVYGHRDRDGAAIADQQEGLVLNLAALRSALRPGQNPLAPSGTLVHTSDDGDVRSVPARPVGDLAVARVGQGLARCVARFALYDLWRAVTPTVSAMAEAVAVATDWTYANGGTADQMRAVLTLTGSATSVTITNESWNPGGLPAVLTIDADFTLGVELDCGEWTAVADPTGTPVNVYGGLFHSGHEQLMPFLPGNNVLEVVPTGGTILLSISARSVYL